MVDKIQHAYGWTDSEILDITVRRAVQIQQAIIQREEIRSWQDLRVTEWGVQNIAGMIANTVEDKKARDTLNEVAQNLSLTGAGKSNSPQATPKKTKKKFKLLDGTEISAKELKDYSYEEIDHSDQDKLREQKARQQNAGQSLLDKLGGFTK